MHETTKLYDSWESADFVEVIPAQKSERPSTKNIIPKIQKKSYAINPGPSSPAVTLSSGGMKPAFKVWAERLVCMYVGEGLQRLRQLGMNVIFLRVASA